MNNDSLTAYQNITTKGFHVLKGDPELQKIHEKIHEKIESLIYNHKIFGPNLNNQFRFNNTVPFINELKEVIETSRLVALLGDLLGSDYKMFRHSVFQANPARSQYFPSSFWHRDNYFADYIDDCINFKFRDFNFNHLIIFYTPQDIEHSDLGPTLLAPYSQYNFSLSRRERSELSKYKIFVKYGRYYNILSRILPTLKNIQEFDPFCEFEYLKKGDFLIIHSELFHKGIINVSNVNRTIVKFQFRRVSHFTNFQPEFKSSSRYNKFQLMSVNPKLDVPSERPYDDRFLDQNLEKIATENLSLIDSIETMYNYESPKEILSMCYSIAMYFNVIEDQFSFSFLANLINRRANEKTLASLIYLIPMVAHPQNVEIQTLLEILGKTEITAYLRAQVCQLIGRLRSKENLCLNFLLESLACENQITRQYAAEALSNLENLDEKTLERISNHLDDPFKYVQYFLIETLIKHSAINYKGQDRLMKKLYSNYFCSDSFWQQRW